MQRFVLYLTVLSQLVIASACAGAGTSQGSFAQASAPTVDAPAIHTQVAATLYAAVPSATPTATQPVAVTQAAAPVTVTTPAPSPTFTPAVIIVPTMENVPLLSDYNSYGVRVLAQPAAVERDGITLAVEQVIVFQDHIELVYTIRDVPHAVLFDPFADNPSYSCSGPASYPNLLLPDGSIIYPEDYLLDGKQRGTFEDFASEYLIHIYRTSVPAEIREMTFSLDCLGMAHLERAPHNWEVPFRLK